ncbi:MAG: hypothetical protein AB7S81_01835 [Bdellovibrionales bacterium]
MADLNTIENRFDVRGFLIKVETLQEERGLLQLFDSVKQELTSDPTKVDRAAVSAFMTTAWSIRKDQGTVCSTCLSLIATLDEEEVTQITLAEKDKPKKPFSFNLFKRRRNPFSLTPIVLGGIFDVALNHEVSEDIRVQAARVAAECLGRHPEYNRELAADLLATFESPSAKVRDAVADSWLAMKENDPSSACRAHVVVAQRILSDNPKPFFRKPEIGPA